MFLPVLQPDPQRQGRQEKEQKRPCHRAENGVQVGVVIRGLEQVHGRGQPQDRRLVHSADIRSSAKSRARGHIEAHGQIEVSVRADAWERKREWLREVEVHVVRGKAAELSHIVAIGINLIGVVEIDGHLEPERLAGVGHVDA